jgi:serine/threonine protein kinase
LKLVLNDNKRGVSSTVRRCIEKETGREFAAKIIDVSADLEDSQGLTIRQASLREINILRLVAGHPYISESFKCFSIYLFFVCSLIICNFFIRHSLKLSNTLQISYHKTWTNFTYLLY